MSKSAVLDRLIGRDTCSRSDVGFHGNGQCFFTLKLRDSKGLLSTLDFDSNAPNNRFERSRVASSLGKGEGR